MSEPSSRAFGAPGIAPTWSSSDEDFVTAALDGTRLWATIGHGIINDDRRCRSAPLAAPPPGAAAPYLPGEMPGLGHAAKAA